MPRENRACLLWACPLGMRRKQAFESEALQPIRDSMPVHFVGPQTMRSFMWHPSRALLAMFVYVCLRKMHEASSGNELGLLAATLAEQASIYLSNHLFIHQDRGRTALCKI